MDEIDRAAMELSRAELEDQLIAASRQYQDAKRAAQNETDEYARADQLRQVQQARDE